MNFLFEIVQVLTTFFLVQVENIDMNAPPRTPRPDAAFAPPATLCSALTQCPNATSLLPLFAPSPPLVDRRAIDITPRTCTPRRHHFPSLHRLRACAPTAQLASHQNEQRDEDDKNTPTTSPSVASATTTTTGENAHGALTTPPGLQPEDIEVLHVTDRWVAVNKPAGLLMHRTKLYPSARGERFLVDLVRHRLRPPARFRERLDIYPIHRLDRPTTGVVLFGLHDSRTAAMLQEALQNSAGARKQYWTLAFDNVDHNDDDDSTGSMPDAWVNDHPLKDITSGGGGRRNRQQRPARTEFERLALLGDVAVVRATLATGRRHQIRRHLSNGRFPVVGDTSHGDTKRNHNAADMFGVQRCCLHARRLSFVDPFTNECVQLQVPVPDDLRQVVHALPGYSDELLDSLDFDDASILDGDTATAQQVNTAEAEAAAEGGFARHQ